MPKRPPKNKRPAPAPAPAASAADAALAAAMVEAFSRVYHHGGIRLGRVVLGGLLAGLLINVLDFVLHGIWLADDWKQMAITHGVDQAAQQGGAMVGWVGLDFLAGLLLAWIYAAIRPRFGAGPLTSLAAGAVLFLAMHSMFASYVWMGFMPLTLFWKATLAGAATTVPCALLAGWMYKE